MKVRNPLTRDAWRAILLAVFLGLAAGWLLGGLLHGCSPCTGGHVIQLQVEAVTK